MVNILINFGRGHLAEHFCEIIMNLDQYYLRYFFYLELCWHFCSAKHLFNFCRGPYEENLCEIILHLDQRFRRCCLKHFLSRALVALCSVAWNHLCNFGRRHHEE